MIGLSSPRSMRVIKQQLRQSLEQSFADAATLADREQAASMQSADFKEGFAAFLQRRPAVFTGA
jgi:2-(1,2-epoxy-1,2-dihydrophenyl)acetyl-CoA isomerase